MTFGIHWFRRDLRIAGNPALDWNWRQHNGNVVGVFCFDQKFLQRPDFSPIRFQFFLHTLEELKKDLKSAGSDLLVLDVSPDDGFQALFEALKQQQVPLPDIVTWNRDYEPFATERDARLAKWFDNQGVKTHTERDHLLIEPHEVYKGNDPKDGYQVFTPFSRAWMKVFETSDVQERLQAATRKPHKFTLAWSEVFKKQTHLDDVLDRYIKANATNVDIKLPRAGAEAAASVLKSFAKRIDDYGTARDIPSVPGTSQLSIYLKNGSITVAQIIAYLGLKPDGRKVKDSRQRYFTELIWREFYYHILARHPRVEHEAFIEKFKNIDWVNRKDWFKAWCAGVTGYPIVDAGMRQLNATGWMHNRVRMIVASFLTKDLHIDWRWGEKYFMEKLIDGDLAPNNGGWQWAASTGCDPQPYFRIFNPKLQSERFDSDGLYIKKWIPELKGLSSKEVHEPSAENRGEYPAPIVDHKHQKEMALRLYATR